MKIKEVCVQTGLSRKTVRLYEEKGLLKPHTVRINGRDFRDYSREDVETLRTIATLRKAWFTMDEIRQMQEDPRNIQAILPQYHQWLRQQKQDLDQLLSVMDRMETENVGSIGDLTRAMAEAAEAMPLPPADIRPRFRYLDELEEKPRTIAPVDPRDRLMAGDKAARQAAVSLSRDKKDDALVKLNLLNDTIHGFKNEESGPVQGKEPEKEPVWLRILSGFLTVVLIVATVIFIRDFMTFHLTIDSLLFFVIAFLLRGSIFYWQHLLEQDKWLERMGIDAKKSRAPDMKTMKRILLGVLSAVILIAGIFLLARAIKDGTNPDFTVTVVSSVEADDRTVEVLKGAVGYFTGDINGDGVVQIRLHWVSPQDYDPKGQELVILSSKELPYFNYEQWLMELPEDVNDSLRPSLASISEQRFWRYANLEGQQHYVGIPRSLSPEEEQAVIELVRAMQTIQVPHQFYT